MLARQQQRAAATRRSSVVVVERRRTTTTPRCPRPSLRVAAQQQQQQKGFGGSSSSSISSSGADASPSAAADQPSPATTTSPSRRDDDAALERLEARLKSRRAAKLPEAKVKVESAAVKLGTGQAPGTAGGAAETLFVQFLGALFVLILVEGLVLAASGFLPESADAAVSEWLYPSYSPQILLFLGMSSLYGLFKTGKLPGQKQL